MLYCPGKGEELLSALATSYTKFPVKIVLGVILGKPAELLIPRKKNI